jgi:NADH-quinone oxidoreductase subunit L
MTANLWIIPLLPALGAAVNGLLGKRFSKTVVNSIALGSTALSFLWALKTVLAFLGNGSQPITEVYGVWMRSGLFSVPFALYVDQLSMVMLLVVTGVGFLIHIYSVGYMSHEGGYYRFFAYLNLFMFFMLTLVLANNYLLMFVGWEGVGLASYLLIGFYFQRESAANAGKKAFITNRVGDFGFLIAMFLLIKHFGSLHYGEVFGAVAQKFPGPEAHPGILTAIAILMMVGAAGKSAQIPLYVWLPDAMEGPTPVSALIHAATMVTAGVYMVARSNAIFSRAPEALAVVAVIGALTAIFAATIGMTQTDIKRVLAYSTVSQLGYMFLGAGVAAYSAGIFHLMTHAFFKALLFLGAGSVIHALSGEQDMRNMGGLRKKIPITFWVMTIATFTIAGFPPLAGFFSKDEILWQAFSSPHGHWALWLVGIVTAFLTSFYMFRLWFMTFFGEYRGAPASHDAHGHGGHDSHGHGEPHESPWIMLAPLVVLAVLSVVGGWVGVPHALGGENRFHRFLAPVMPAVSTEVPAEQAKHVTPSEAPENPPSEHPAALPAPHGAGGEDEADVNKERAFAGISTLVALAGFGMAWFLYYKRRDLPERITDKLGGVYSTVLNKYYIDELYYNAIIHPLVQGSSKVLWRGVDAGIIDGSVNNAAIGAKHASDNVRHMQSGNIRSYAGWVATGAALVLVYMIWMGTR